MSNENAEQLTPSQRLENARLWAQGYIKKAERAGPAGTGKSRKADQARQRAMNLANAGRMKEAFVAFEQALALNPTDKRALSEYGNTLHRTANHQMALERLSVALELDAEYAPALSAMAVVVEYLGDQSTALKYHEKALKSDQKYAPAHLNLAVTLQSINRVHEAIRHLDIALELDPKLDFAKLWHAKCLGDLGRYKESLDEFNQVDSSLHRQFLLPLGTAYMRTGQEEKALAVFDRAVNEVTDRCGALINKGMALRGLHRHAEAFKALSDAIDVDFHRAEAYYNLSFVLLEIGEWESGWELYEWRLKFFDTKISLPPHIQRWDAKASLSGKRILIVAEQGLGDMIQFSRYALQLRDLGAKVVLQCYKPLTELISSLGPEIELTSLGSKEASADYYIPLMSLPYAMKTSTGNVPYADRYLNAPDALISQWREKLAEAWDEETLNGDEPAFCLGLVWAGSAGHANDHNRSMKLAQLEPLFKIPGVAINVIQKEMSESDRAWLERQPNVKIWSDELTSFSDTAALMSLLDATITVDTSVAHVAGATGCPFWMMVPYAPDPRWMITRNDTPWYKSGELFRQEKPSDWAPVVARLVDRLDALVAPHAVAQRRVKTAEKPALKASETQGIVLAEVKKVIPCKVCAGDSHLWGVADFNKNCEEQRGLYLPLSGIPVYYHQCSRCKLVFTAAMDDWSKDDFALHIYNESYVQVDPDYKEVRPRAFSETVHQFAKNVNALTVLDYGGGSGLMARLLREKGTNCVSWDPFVNEEARPSPGGFDLITCFEVFEHTPDPVGTMYDLLKFARPRSGMVLFSTLCIDEIKNRDIGFWYIAPRNGHITIHTQQSLKALVESVGWKLHHFSTGTHLAYLDRPAFLR